MKSSFQRWLNFSPHICLLISTALMISVTSCYAQGNSKIPSGIAWHGVLTDGLADAKATNRPIMLLSAAPQCAGVPGMW